MSNHRLLQILNYVISIDKPVATQQIATALNIPMSTLYRHLQHLKKWGFLTDSTQKNKLSVGAIGLQMAQQYLNHSFLIEASKRDLMMLAAKTQETVALMVCNYHHAVCVDMIESRHALRCSFAVGKAQPLNKGSSAKGLLAFMGEAQQTEILRHLLPEKNKRYHLQQELKIIVEQGFATSFGEVDQGVWGVSVPLFKKKELQGVITIMVPEMRIQDKEMLLIEAAKNSAAMLNEYFELYLS